MNPSENSGKSEGETASKAQKKPKILYVITKSNWGGAQRYVYELATSLPKDRYETAVAFGNDGNVNGKMDTARKIGALKERLDDAGIRTIPIPSLQRDINALSDLRAFFFLIALFWREQPDVIHLNSSKIGGLGALAGRIVGIFTKIFRQKTAQVPLIIFTGHGWAFNENRNLLSKTAIIFIHWLTILLTHKTVAVSGKIRDQIVRMPFMRNKIVVIHNGIPVRQFESELLTKKVARVAMGMIASEGKSEASSEKKSAPDSEIFIGTISELHRNKGLDYLIEATALLQKEPTLPDWRILIVGEGEERAALEALIAKHKLAGRVILKGYVADARIYLKAFDIFTLTSRTEGLPYAILEAGLAELPVLASTIGGIPEIIEQSASGILVKSGDTKGIATALSLLIKEPDRRAALGAALKARITRDFSLDQMLAETEKLYEKKS